LSATLLELSFIAGFFTKKYDRLLLALVVIFLVMDHLIMRITYYEIAPLALTFMFSKEISSDKSTPGCESKL
jgi:ABC-type dipeptide/oligopeptide/nickel transport system permease subunit